VLRRIVDELAILTAVGTAETCHLYSSGPAALEGNSVSVSVSRS